MFELEPYGTGLSSQSEALRITDSVQALSQKEIGSFIGVFLKLGGGWGKLIIVSPCQDPPWSSVSFEYLVPKLINEPTLIVNGVLAKSIKRRDSDWLSESMWYDSSLDVSKDSSRQRASRSLSRKRLLQYQYLVSKGKKGSGQL